jgi:hypothetical protein
VVTATISELELLPEFKQALSLFEKIGWEIHPQNGIWSCDGGAAVFFYICCQLGLPSELCVGLYWWDGDYESLNRKHRLMEGVELNPENLDWYFRDEHHHWVRVFYGDLCEQSLIVDPNGEIRGEPRVQNYTDTVRYEQKSEQKHFLVYDPDEPIEEIAARDEDVARGIARVDTLLGFG